MALLTKSRTHNPTLCLTISRGILRSHTIRAIQRATIEIVGVPIRQLPLTIRPRRCTQHQPTTHISDLLGIRQTGCEVVYVCRTAVGPNGGTVVDVKTA